MLTVNTNNQALFGNRMLAAGRLNLHRSMERLSSGLRINSAKDDASGLAIADRMTSQIRGLNQANRNINDGISLLQTAEGALQEVTNLLQRGRELALQAANDVMSESDKKSLQAEVNQIKAEINRIGRDTTFNGQFILRSDSITSTSLTQDKIDIQDSLRSGWLKNSEKMIQDGFGLTGVGRDLKIVYEANSNNGFVAWVTNGYSTVTREAVTQELHIDLSDFIPVDTPDGGTPPYYSDRIIAHEMVHAVMGVAMNALDLETWFLEGAAEVIQGADERLLGTINARLAANGNDIDNAVNGLVATIGVAWNDGSNPTLLNEQYATAYTALRFLHSEIKGAGGTGIAELMGLLSANKGDNNYALDEALADIKVAHTSFAYNTEAGFIAAFTASDGVGFDFVKAMYTSGALNNDDTGAVGGMDADGGMVRTAKSVVPNGALYRDSPLEGFTTVWEELRLANTSVESVLLQIGANARQTVSVAMYGINSASMNIDEVDISRNSPLAIIKFDRALALIDENRGELGAQMNRLEYASAVASNVAENLSSARSRILDADIAQETTNMTRASIIQQASISVLSQANSLPQLALQLLS